MFSSIATLFIAVVTFSSPHTQYALTTTQQQEVVGHRSSWVSQPHDFETPTEAAYAAARKYASTVDAREAGAKIYLDIVGGVPRYSFGTAIFGQTDNDSADEEVVYAPWEHDGHVDVVGLWHRHPMDAAYATMQGHAEIIESAHQTIWTSLRQDLYVQYWAGSGDPSTAQPQLVCSDCLP